MTEKNYTLKFYYIDIDCENLYVRNDNLQEVLEIFEDFATSAYCSEQFDDGPCVIELMFREKPNMEALTDYTNKLKQEFGIKIKEISERIVDDCDWLLQVYKNFPPIIIDNFFVYGSHYEEEIPNNLIGLQIDAATAFGSGEHGTTKGCLQSLQTLHSDEVKFKNVLDMGCGSGILAIAASKIWEDARITAVDIDEEAIKVTDHHIKINNCKTDIKTEAGDGYNSPIVGNNTKFDLIIANILAGPLKLMAKDLAFNLDKGGYCILAGLLVRQEKDIVDIHEKYGMKFISSFNIDNWQIITMKKT